jgi:hypothetical protein
MLFYIIIISVQHFILITTREVELFNVSVILLEHTKKNGHACAFGSFTWGQDELSGNTSDLNLSSA